VKKIIEGTVAEIEAALTGAMLYTARFAGAKAAFSSR
jgi:hypothetical protein